MDLIWKVGTRAKDILLLKEADKKPNEKMKGMESTDQPTECPSSSNREDQNLQMSDERAATLSNESFAPECKKKEPVNSEESLEQSDTTYFPGKISTDNMKEVSLKAVEQARSFGTFLYGVANRTTSSLSETAKYLKDTVEQNSILGDFNKQHEEFLSGKTSKWDDTGIPPWIGCENEENIRQQILSLSSDKRNFLRNPPSGVSFEFSYDSMYPVAAVMLKEDPSLEKMRFDMVPKCINEENFWRNYFYRVSLLKQSNRLSSKSHKKNASGDSASWATKKDTSESGPSTSNILKETAGNSNQEFVSDDFQSSHVSKEGTEQGMKLLGVEQSKKDDDWEEELQQELQEYEVVVGENADDDLALENEDQIFENKKVDDQKSGEFAVPK